MCSSDLGRMCSLNLLPLAKSNISLESIRNPQNIRTCIPPATGSSRTFLCPNQTLAVSFNRMRVSDLVLVDHAGSLIEGEQPVNPVGVMLHSAIHRAHADVVAVCHAHSTYGSAWSALGRPIAPITQDTAIFHDDQAIIREPRVALDMASADLFAAHFEGKHTGIQVGHGLFTLGQSVDEAAWRFITMDRACHVQLLAEAAGNPEHWPDEMAVAFQHGNTVLETVDQPAFAWLATAAAAAAIASGSPRKPLETGFRSSSSS